MGAGEDTSRWTGSYFSGTDKSMRDEGRQGSKRVSLLAAAGHAAPRRGQARDEGSQGWCAGIPLRNDAKLRRRGRIGEGGGVGREELG